MSALNLIPIGKKIQEKYFSVINFVDTVEKMVYVEVSFVVEARVGIISAQIVDGIKNIINK